MSRSQASQFGKGSIVRVTMHQFMTYQDVVVHPGPRLNLVMGPNGSGKSTIMCGIALGLGATPRVLGRADNVGEFIMTGCDAGYVEIELYDNGARSYVVRRELQRSTRGSSKWKIDGNQANEAQVRARAPPRGFRGSGRAPCARAWGRGGGRGRPRGSARPRETGRLGRGRFELSRAGRARLR